MLAMQPRLTRRHLLVAATGFGAGRLAAAADARRDTRWESILRDARGQSVYFNAWAGSEHVNSYLQWAASEVAARFGVRLEHVKISDTAEAVKRVRAEQRAGRTQDGSVDALWINGENFATMKADGLLFGPFSERLPNYAWVDTAGKPTTRVDFSVPVDGMEAPWGMAQLTFYADGQRVPQPPQNMNELTDYARRHPGRFTYPKPPNFHGTTFVKQLLLEASADRKPFYAPSVAAQFASLTAPLWSALDRLHPLLWRQGRQFPANNTLMRQMLADGELLISLTFNPNEAANEIAAGRLPASVVSWQPAAGSIANTHFIAIPFNARAKAGAQVLIDFLLSPPAQARKADIRFWGDPTVLALERLPAGDQALFAQVAAPGEVARNAPAWLEPHASWVAPIEREWLRRYGQ